jgi:hypothetical protein
MCSSACYARSTFWRRIGLGKKKYKSPVITKKAYIQKLTKQFKDFPLEDLDKFQKMCIETLSV